MASFPMLLSMLKQVLTQPSLEIGLTEHLLVHNGQRPSDSSLIGICTMPIHRLIWFGWNKTLLVNPR
jgi:hypothetical protein